MKIEPCGTRGLPCTNFGCKRPAEVLVNGLHHYCKKCAKKLEAQQYGGR